jgi:endonuclease/exonuclease/phosphatase family metal-dependent hydrolase
MSHADTYITQVLPALLRDADRHIMRVLLALLLVTGCARARDYGDGPVPPPACRLSSVQQAEPVRWLLPPADGSRLDAWCAAVGPALVWNSPAADTRERVDSLLAVSWNVRVGGGDLELFTRQLRSGVLTGGGPVRHFVILLQETFRHDDAMPAMNGATRGAPRIARSPPAGERLPIDEAARDLGLSVAYVPSMRNGALNGDTGGEDRGNAIVSTLPLHEVMALELPVVRQRRVAVAAVVRGRTSAGTAWELQVASAHLENRGGPDLAGVQGRAAQAEWLVQSLPPARAAVLGADLNTWVSGDRESAARLLMPYYPATPVAHPPGPTHVSHLILRGRLDYLFARVQGGRMTSYERVPALYGSDHYPLLAWIHLPRYR